MQNIKKIEDKKSFRKLCLKKLKKESKVSKFQKDKKAIKNLKSILNLKNRKNILCYLPLKNEINLMPLIYQMRKKHNIFVPFMEGVSFKMVKFRLPLFEKEFNILEPSNSNFNANKLDIAIVPIIGIDGDFKRVGFGRGMYDRFFEKLNHKPIIIFIQISYCFTKNIVTDYFDIKGDYLITPKKIIKLGKGTV